MRELVVRDVGQRFDWLLRRGGGWTARPTAAGRLHLLELVPDV